MERYSVEWKTKRGAWVQDHQAFDTSGMPCKVWKLHYIQHDTEYSTGKYGTKKEASEALATFKAASALGRKGGSVKSEAKTKASRDNGKRGGRPTNEYFVVPAPGYYGDKAKVSSSHRTLQAAQKAAGKGFIVRKGDLTKGQQWLRVYEDIYPVAQTTRKGE